MAGALMTDAANADCDSSPAETTGSNIN